MITLFRRLGIFLLFVVALYSTFSSISNVDINDWVSSLERRGSLTIVTDHSLAIDKPQAFHEERVSALKTKDVFQYIKKSHQTLEERIEIEQYPTTQVTATGYTAGIESTGKTIDHPAYGITYSGVEVKRDLYSTIAADLDLYPIGTVMYIPDYGYGVVADKGSAITGHKIDLYYPTVEDVYSQWGKKDVEVYIIEMGEGELTEEDLQRLNEEESMQVFREQYLAE